MTIEQDFFLQVIADFLKKQKTTAPKTSLDWDIVQKYAFTHQLEGVFCYQCKSHIADAKKLQASYSSTLFYYANRMQLIKKLKNDLQIPWFIIKGASVAEFYPVPALRTMGDTDIVVHTQDREAAHQAMITLGCRNDSRYADREWVYHKGNMEFEIHDHLVYTETINQTDHERYFNDFWKYVKDSRLDWNFHFLFLVLHLRKHLMNSGVGFRQFMDLAVLAIYNKELDWVWIRKELHKLNLLEFVKVCYALIERWFGVSPPIDIDILDNNVYEMMTEKIFQDGIFGFDNPENQSAMAVNEMRAGEKRFLVIMKKVFPPYNTMVTIPHYAFLIGRCYLLPFAWIYRFYRAIRHQRISIGVHDIKKSFASKEVIQKRSDMLDQWKL